VVNIGIVARSEGRGEEGGGRPLVQELGQGTRQIPAPRTGNISI
jgi:hypothetical protein